MMAHPAGVIRLDAKAETSCGIDYYVTVTNVPRTSWDGLAAN